MPDDEIYGPNNPFIPRGDTRIDQQKKIPRKKEIPNPSDNPFIPGQSRAVYNDENSSLNDIQSQIESKIACNETRVLGDGLIIERSPIGTIYVNDNGQNYIGIHNMPKSTIKRIQDYLIRKS